MNLDEESILAREAQLIFSNVNGFNMGESLRVWRGKVKAGPPNNKLYEFEFILPHGFPNEKPILKAKSTIFHPNVSHDGYVNLDILERWRPEFHGYQVLLQLMSLLRRSPPQREPAYASSIKSKDHGYIARPESSLKDTARSNIIRKAINEPGSSGTTKRREPQQQEIQDLAILKKQMSTMREQMTKQEEELTRFRAREAIGISPGSKTDLSSKKSSLQAQEAFKHLKTDDQVAELESEQIAISELMAGLQEKYQTGELSIFDYSKLYKKYSRDLYILRKKLDYIRSKQ
jgi:ubiquitin-protein ligase